MPLSNRPVKCAACRQPINDVISAFVSAGQCVHKLCPGPNRLLAAKRRHRHEPIKRATVFERDGWKCGICRKKIDKRLQHPHPMSAVVDHVVPIKLGGPNTYVNVQAAHWKCNATKSWTGHGDQLALIG
ncbi:HNH endonuclease [Mycobacterium gordonae]|uniref:HNH nuclease domain-containing protein n=1 Tax=Mycobacterium gordonae TaxID=1778 RepID=A0A1X1WPG4_MYCGO|nr:HNH endonuclease signature motif containing protein [Mycobacterium gordonae]MCV7004617.1 HNH endonuclease [Mycobacterium gordonae]ODR16031.1 hypothetical protein BHQ23_31315 [Mycobacterium gordonae]ORV88536.1 hypothetical protein AWC08_22365 [Mycobacterium gordonae]